MPPGQPFASCWQIPWPWLIYTLLNGLVLWKEYAWFVSSDVPLGQNVGGELISSYQVLKINCVESRPLKVMKILDQKVNYETGVRACKAIHYILSTKCRT